MKHLKQRLSYNAKVKNNFEWAKEQIDSIITYSGEDWKYNGQQYARNSRLMTMLRSYELYNNQISDEDFNEYFDTLKYDVGQKRDKIMPYNKAHNKINVLLGELLKRPFDARVVLTNTEGAAAIFDKRRELLREYIEAETAKQIALQQIQQTVPAEKQDQAAAMIEQQFADVKGPEEIEDFLRNEYLEPREIKSNKILEDMTMRLNLPEMRRDAFKHALLSAEEHCWIGVRNGKLIINVLNTPNVIYQKSQDVKYVQYGSFAGYGTKMNVADVLDTFRNLKDEDIKMLEERYSYASYGNHKGDWKRTRDDSYERFVNSNLLDSTSGQYGGSYMDDVEVYHVEWRSQRKIGFFTYLDESGEPTTEIVDESFPFDKGNPNHISIEYDWIPEIWEGVRIDNDIYTDIRPIPYQFVDPENPYEQPLRYKGVIYDNTNAAPISVMERMRPFQMLYLVVMHKLKKLIARDRGMIMPVDLSKLDKDMSLEEQMYYLDELDVYFYNSLANAEEPGAAQRSGIDSPVSRSTSNQIIQYINILNYLDEQIGEVAGVTRAREGQTSPYEAVTNAQQSIMQSSNITEILFDTHIKFWEKVLNDAIDLAVRIADREGGSYSTMDSNYRRNYMTIQPGEFQNARFGLFVTSDPRSAKEFNEIKQLIPTILQRDKGKLSHVIKMVRQKTSIEDLIRDIEKFESYMEQQEQAQMQAQQQQVQMQIDAAERQDAANKAFEARENQLDRESNERIAEVRASVMKQGQDVNENMIPDTIEREKLKQDMQMQDKDLASKERMKDKELASKERVEKYKVQNKPKPSSK